MQTLSKDKSSGKPKTTGETKTRAFNEYESPGNLQQQKTLNGYSLLAKLTKLPTKSVTSIPIT